MAFKKKCYFKEQEQLNDAGDTRELGLARVKLEYSLTAKETS